MQYFVEACDTAGNCGYSSNKGRYFDAQPLPPASGSITLTPSRAPGTGSWYTGPLDVTASAGTATVSVSVDGGAFESAAAPVALSGNGAHVVDARASDGSETTQVFLIDAQGPAITHTVVVPTPDGANGWYTSAPTITFTCPDDVSGLAPGSCTIDGSSTSAASVTLGESANAQAVAATATDNAGNVSHDSVAGLKVDLSNPSTPVFTGIHAGIYAVNSVPAAAAIGCTSTDAISGVQSCTFTGYGSALGSHTLTATATDNAGRKSTSTLTYTVGFQTGDILPPVTAAKGDQGNPLATDLSVSKIKSTIPVKFQLYLDAAKTLLMKTPPAGSSATLTVGKYDSTTNSTDVTSLITGDADSGDLFRWTGASDYQYIFNLKTTGRTAGTYWVTITLSAADGTVLAQSPRQYFILRS